MLNLADVSEYLPAVARYGWLGAMQLYGMFLAGQALHILRRASAAIQSAANPINSRIEYVKKYWDVILIRTAFALAFFWGWINNPDLIAKYTGLNFTLPVGAGTSLMFGLCSDMVIDWVSQKIPRLAKEIPSTPQEAEKRVEEAKSTDGGK